MDLSNKITPAKKPPSFKILITSKDIDKDIVIEEPPEKTEEGNKNILADTNIQNVQQKIENVKDTEQDVSSEPKKLKKKPLVSKILPKTSNKHLDFVPEEDTDTEDDSEEKSEEEQPTYDPANVHYEGDCAIYTDPKSGYQYTWNDEENEWKSKKTVQEYGFEDDTHTYTDAQGAKFFWDKDKNAWFPKIDDEFMAHYQMNYGFIDNTTKPEEVKIEKPKEVKVVEKGLKRPPPKDPTWFDVKDEENRNVYVSNLPTDITEEEFVDFMQKCGLVMRDMATGKMKVKLYVVPGTDILKGDALCTYIKLESVELALNVLDGYLYKEKRIKVERAQFQMKGDYNPTLKPKKKRKKDKEKLKKMQEKLFDWRPEKLRGERSKHERIVIVKNLFVPELFDQDVGLILEYQQDLREECTKCGEVKKVTLFDRHPEGVAQINMKEPEQADEVVKLLNGRWFGKRVLNAEIWDGRTKYKIGETDAQISKRINEWDKFLESDDTKKTNESKVPETGEIKVPETAEIKETETTSPEAIKTSSIIENELKSNEDIPPVLK